MLQDKCGNGRKQAHMMRPFPKKGMRNAEFPCRDQRGGSRAFLCGMRWELLRCSYRKHVFP